MVFLDDLFVCSVYMQLTMVVYMVFRILKNNCMENNLHVTPAHQFLYQLPVPFFCIREPFPLTFKTQHDCASYSLAALYFYTPVRTLRSCADVLFVLCALCALCLHTVHDRTLSMNLTLKNEKSLRVFQVCPSTGYKLSNGTTSNVNQYPFNLNPPLASESRSV